MPIQHGPKGLPATIPKERNRDEYGIPFSVGEVRTWLEMHGKTIEDYPRQLIEWLCDRVETLEENK